MKSQLTVGLPLATLTIAFLAFSSCQSGIRGSGNVTTEIRDIKETFTKIKVESGLDVVVEQSSGSEVTVRADDNIQKHISTTVSAGTLFISSDIGNFRGVKMKQITIKLPVIEQLTAESGAELNSKNTIRSENLVLESNSGAEIHVSVNTRKLTCETSSGSETDVSGTTVQLECASSAGSSLEALSLTATDVIASASSGSSCKVHPVNDLRASASSGGSIIYKGVPKNVKKEENSGGSVRQR